jgi:molybdate transport system ATP-binding protein
VSSQASAATFLDAHVVVRRPGHTLDVRLTAAPGDVVAVIGPNGAGKSTLVRALAGIEALDEGHVVCDGETWDQPGAARVDARARRVGMVFQQGLLFPHLTALDNVAYGPRSRGSGRRDARAAALGWLDRLGVSDLADRRPAQLSGGQSQRVAIARALATDPRLLLLDEPLASLDIARREEVLPYFERLRDELSIPMIYVSHQFEEVLRLATHAVLLEQGRVVTQGALDDVSLHPDLRAIVGPEAVGSVLTGTVEAHGGDIAGLAAVRVGSNVLHVALRDARAGASVRVQLLARDVILATARPENISVRNVMIGTIARIAGDDADTHMIHIDIGGPLVLARVTRAASTALDLQQGRQVWVLVKAVSIRGHAFVRNPPPAGAVRKLTY